MAFADAKVICAIHLNGQKICGKLSDDLTIYTGCCEHYRLLFLFPIPYFYAKNPHVKSDGHCTTKKQW
jgi:hypothetical protein